MSLSPLQQLVLEKLSPRRPTTLNHPGTQEAGIALILGSDPDAILVIRRAERADDPWSGHMGLPGGRRGPADLDLVATAIRETDEEVGLTLASSTLLGQMDDVAPQSQIRPTILARPFIFGVSGHPPLTLNLEVSAAFWIPVVRLSDPVVLKQVRLEIQGDSRFLPAYRIEEGLIWGMTERVLTSFLEIAFAS